MSTSLWRLKEWFLSFSLKSKNQLFQLSIFSFSTEAVGEGEDGSSNQSIAGIFERINLIFSYSATRPDLHFSVPDSKHEIEKRNARLDGWCTRSKEIVFRAVEKWDFYSNLLMKIDTCIHTWYLSILGIITLFRPVKGTPKSAWIHDKIAKNAKNKRFLCY